MSDPSGGTLEERARHGGQDCPWCDGFAAGLEKAAKIADKGGYPKDFERGSSEDCAIRSARNEIAAAIRAYAEGI